MFKKNLFLILIIFLISNSVYAEPGDSQEKETVFNYCMDDYNGARLNGEYDFPYTQWKEEAGWDTCDVIESFTIIKQHNDSVIVKFKTYGTLDSLRFICEKKEEIVEFKTTQIKGRTIITSPVYHPKISTHAAHELIDEIVKNKPEKFKKRFQLQKCIESLNSFSKD